MSLLYALCQMDLHLLVGFVLAKAGLLRRTTGAEKGAEKGDEKSTESK